MGVFYEDIPDNIAAWIATQKMLWVATAPLSASGHVNVSPKGGESFGVLDKKTFWYMDLTGSGVETVAHLRENGRITVMFCAFEGPPRIVRLWGYGRRDASATTVETVRCSGARGLIVKGKILERDTKAYDDFVATHHIETIPATRSIIIVDVHQAGSSCGFSVPYYDFKTFRTTLTGTFEKREKEFKNGDPTKSLDRYWAYKNAWSVDGLPAMQQGLETAARENIAPLGKMVGPRAPANPFGPGSTKLQARIQSKLGTLQRAQFGLVSMLLVTLLAFVLGSVAGPQVQQFLDAQSSRLSRLVL